MNTRARGNRGEDRAAEYLRKKSWEILFRNFRTKSGEVDIIALDRDVLVFLEVKSWSAFSAADLEYGINKAKRRRIIRVSREFLMENPKLADNLVRYDVLFIGGDGEKIEHYAGVFTETGMS